MEAGPSRARAGARDGISPHEAGPLHRSSAAHWLEKIVGPSWQKTWCGAAKARLFTLE